MSCQMSEMPVKVLKVLLVDDDEDDFMITKDTLSNSEVLEFDIEWVNTYDAALPVMLENRHDVCLIDYRLGMRSGLDLMKETISRGSTIPKILVTGQGDQLVDDESMRAGAADYLVKGCYDKALLERSIRYAVEHHRTMQVLLQREQELRESQKMEAVGRLAGGVAHELNNLMTVLLANVEFVKEEVEDNQEVIEFVDEIRNAGRRSCDLTTQLLTFGSRQGNEPQLLDINRTLGDMQSTLCRVMGDEIQFESILGSVGSQISVDREQFELLVMNLIVNARDAMAGGGKRVLETADIMFDEARANNHPGTVVGPYVMLSIRDTGCGMDEKTTHKAFEPFFTTKDLGKGSGLGLSTVYGIVRKAGGHVSLYSDLGEETTVKAYFPSTCSRVENQENRPAPISPCETLRGVP